MSLENKGFQTDIERLNFSDRDFPISKNAPVYTYGEIATNSDIFPQSNGASPLINLKSFRNDKRFADIKGQNFATVILDTGIDRNHPFSGPTAIKMALAIALSINTTLQITIAMPATKTDMEVMYRAL